MSAGRRRFSKRELRQWRKLFVVGTGSRAQSRAWVRFALYTEWRPLSELNGLSPLRRSQIRRNLQNAVLSTCKLPDPKYARSPNGAVLHTPFIHDERRFG